MNPFLSLVLLPGTTIVVIMKITKGNLSFLVRKSFLPPANSHRLLVAIVVIIETEVIFVFIHKIDNLRTFLLCELVK